MIHKKGLDRILARIAIRDRKERDFFDTADMIQQTQAQGQPPPIWGRTLDKGLEMQAEKAKLWNQIRGLIIPGQHKTLWQEAIARNLDVGRWGKEEHLKITANQIRELLTLQESLCL